MKLLVHFVIFVALAIHASAATYYVATSGNDANDGSVGGPFLTVGKAASVAAAGDTVSVATGNYSQTNINLNTSGTHVAPIVFDGNAAATNYFGFQVMRGMSNIVIQNFRHSSNSYLAYILRTANSITVSNCISTDALAGGGVYFESPGNDAGPHLSASNCVVISNQFVRLTNTTAIDLHGVGHSIFGNTIRDIYACDALRLFGSNTVIRGNYFTNVIEESGYGNHPDIMQTFGNNGHWMVDFIFERNRIDTCPVQLMQMEAMTVASNLWSITLRNNLFENGNMQCSIDVPNVRFHNNTFYKCSNGAGLFSFAFYDPGSSGDDYYRGSAYGGEMLNNAFVECSGLYSVVNLGPPQGALTAADAGGGGRAGSGFARIKFGSGNVRIWGTYTNMTGGVSNAVLYVAGGADTYYLTATNFAAGVFDFTQPLVEGAGGMNVSTEQYGVYNSYGFKLRICSTNYPAGEASGAIIQFVIDPPPTLVTNYNYAGGAGGATVAEFNEVNGVNGGDPGFTDAAGDVFTLTSSSVLRNAASDLSAQFTTDYAGNIRSAWDIGAYEFNGSTTYNGVRIGPGVSFHGGVSVR